MSEKMRVYTTEDCPPARLRALEGPSRGFELTLPVALTARELLLLEEVAARTAAEHCALQEEADEKARAYETLYRWLRDKVQMRVVACVEEWSESDGKIRVFRTDTWECLGERSAALEADLPEGED